MSGRHTGEQHSHTVEGTDPQLYVGVHEPASDAGLRPVLLLHGFSSSSKLNWEDTGWITALLRPAAVSSRWTCPATAAAAPPRTWTPTPQQDPRGPAADRVRLRSPPLRDGDPSSGLDLIGYSLGSRLAWEFGATQHELVHRLVLGGPNVADPLADFDLVAAQRYLADGTPISDASTAGLLKMAQMLPSNNIFSLLSLWRPSRRAVRSRRGGAAHAYAAGGRGERRAGGSMPELQRSAPKPGPWWNSWSCRAATTPTPSPAGPSSRGLSFLGVSPPGRPRATRGQPSPSAPLRSAGLTPRWLTRSSVAQRPLRT